MIRGYYISKQKENKPEGEIRAYDIPMAVLPRIIEHPDGHIVEVSVSEFDVEKKAYHDGYTDSDVFVAKDAQKVRPINSLRELLKAHDQWAIHNKHICCDERNSGAAYLERRVGSALTSKARAFAATADWEQTAIVEERSSVACVVGSNSHAIANHEESCAAATARESTAITNGYCSIAAVTDINSVAVAASERSVAASTHNYSLAACAGTGSVAVATSYSGAAALSPGSFAFAAGAGCRAKGVIGSFLIFAIQEETDTFEPKVIDAKVFPVDGVTVKENIWYEINKNGELFESKNQKGVIPPLEQEKLGL